MAIDTLKNNPSPETLAVWSLTPNGRVLGRKLQAAFKGSHLFVSAKTGAGDSRCKNTTSFETLSREISVQFNRFSGHVFIFSTGIAVRIIAPLLRSKTMDPAVVVVDDHGTHAISLLSGHLGGANRLARAVAAAINAVPVITTATDINDLPAIDLMAKEMDLVIETPWNIKHTSMAFLLGEAVPLLDPLGIVKKRLPQPFWTPAATLETVPGQIYCSHEIKDVSRETLILRPRVLSVGIGCNRGTRQGEIKAFLLRVLEQEALSLDSVFRFATTRVKADEEGLLALSEEMGIPLDFYTKEALNSVKTIKTPSKMVEKHLGVKSVCEAAAILSAGNGNLIVTKKKNKDVTIAVAIKK